MFVAITLADVGWMSIAIAGTVTVAEAAASEFATEVAVTVTMRSFVGSGGAV